jgi:hypothetical protein
LTGKTSPHIAAAVENQKPQISPTSPSQSLFTSGTLRPDNLMSILPGPLQTTGIVLSALLPLILYFYARIGVFRGAGRLFRAGAITVIALFALGCVGWPGPRDAGDAFGGMLLLLTTILLCHIFWSLLAWGFTVTLLTAIADAGKPLTLEQWISAYMQGGELSGFAHNRLRLLVGSGMVVAREGRITVTPFGMLTARLVRLNRFATGIG